MGSGAPISRRAMGAALMAGWAARLAAQQNGHSGLPESVKGTVLPAVSRRYQDAATELTVFRLTDPAYASTLPAYYNRALARTSAWLLFASARSGPAQAFRMDLKTAEWRQLTDTEELDSASLTLTPDNRSFAYFAGRSLWIAPLASLRERKLHEVPAGWERTAGLSIAPDGLHAFFAERKDEGSRLRILPLARGAAATVTEAPFAITHPIARPERPQILFRQEDRALWLVNADGQQKRQLKLAPGRIGPANWTADGRSILYLNFPEDPRQLNNIREHVPETGADRLVAKTSQYADFGFNRNASVFVGASRNHASPDIILMLRVTGREMTLCEHKSSHPAETGPRFAPDSQRIYFQSDREGKPAIYDVHVDDLVSKTEG